MLAMTSTTVGPAVGGAELRRAMSRFATGVTIVTSLDGAGSPVGATANAIASLSLEPPLILVCLARESLTLAAIRRSGAFGVNVLGSRHEAVSTAFARRGSGEAWEAVDHHRGVTGAPRLREAIAHVECAVDRELPGGDHAIVVGRVLTAAAGDGDERPLVFYRGAYASLAP